MTRFNWTEPSDPDAVPEWDASRDGVEIHLPGDRAVGVVAVVLLVVLVVLELTERLV